ncbi:MAG: radical SAM protein [Desulfuromonadales bacterium]
MTSMYLQSQKTNQYQGFELGPIRPPSEAGSLLLRVTRNCPWNKCTFCGLYKGEKFSIRPVDHVCKDIDRVRYFVDEINHALTGATDRRNNLTALQIGLSASDRLAFHSAFNWMRGGMKSVFLQDANTLILKPADLVAILEHLRQVFPQVERVTSYARSHSIARISDENMIRLAAVGLNRIHVGMESGCNEVLDFIRKGVDKQTHIFAGKKVKKAGIELSEYFMPGLGGENLSIENAVETADAMNQIDPDFIRIRTLAIPEVIELHKEVETGHFKPLGEKKKAEELLLFLDHLQNISSIIRSDHILNLFQDVDGKMPQDHAKITAPIRTFLAMPPQEQILYIVGRRTGVFTGIADIDDEVLRGHAEKALIAHQVTLENVEIWASEMMQRFI